MRKSGTADLLDTAYSELGFSDVDGDRWLEAYAKPPEDLSLDTWLENGDWLALAHAVRAERIFFVDNNPVVVFARLKSSDWQTLQKFYSRVWSMARPRLLFLATPGELAVYDLAHKPPRETEGDKSLKPLEIAKSVAEVSEKLQRFRREEIESGQVFEAEKHFGDLSNRADGALIRDLKAVRKELVDKGLGGKSLRYAHALIGRSIFIRYLEDRGILTEQYFQEVAGKNGAWKDLLKQPPSRRGHEIWSQARFYPRVLKDHRFTYALFARLAKDFNGDMFPDVGTEEGIVGSDHLKLIQDLMYGDVGPERKLFFDLYDFSIVPMELISSIYEEFYHEESTKSREHGAFYMPPALVDFVLSQALPADRLKQDPRIMDPSCGSGIFLVESFRRIVRYRTATQGRRLRFDELQKILREQIAGIDVNPEAIRVAAFSLYLAMLHYLEPKDILEQIQKGNRLPNLVVDQRPGSKSLKVLLAANAFDTKMIESEPALTARFSSKCADVVVGNPPWGAPKGSEGEARRQNIVAMDWCKQHDRPVGDLERSQAFIWRALDLLKEKGIVGLLVSTGVFFKHHEKSLEFRRKWLGSCILDSVFSFSHCRHVFFRSDTTAPFALVVFRGNDSCIDKPPIHYWSAKRTKIIEGLQAIVFSRSDLRQITPDTDLVNHWTWKTLWWGGHRDLGLIRYLMTLRPLDTFTKPDLVGKGFEAMGDEYAADWLGKYQFLPSDGFDRYSPLAFEPPSAIPQIVHRRGNQNIYDGLRLLIARGIKARGTPKGVIIARLEKDSFCFKDSIYGVVLPDMDESDHKVVLGVLWSSVARYFLFLVSSNWGNWYDQIKLHDELLTLPIRLPDDKRLKDRLIAIVDRLRCYDPPVPILDGNAQTPAGLERELDDIIFEMYGLAEADVDLIRDMCEIGIDFLYNKDKNVAVQPVASREHYPRTGNMKTKIKDPLGDYLRVFIQSWAAYLDPGTELHWEVHVSPKSDSMLAAVFTVHDIGDAPGNGSTESRGWNDVLQRLDKSMQTKMSSRIYVEGLARSVSDNDIIIIKRNEKRLWTKSAAREDAEAALVQAMRRESIIRGRST